MSTKDGRINRAQVTLACEQFSHTPATATRIVVTHHPIDVPADDTRHPTLTRARMAITAFSKCHVDLFLSGHLHAGLSLASSARYRIPGYSAVIAHAGTAISTRTRNEPNAWNLITLAPGSINIQQMSWNGKKFAPARLDQYQKLPGGWTLKP